MPTALPGKGKRDAARAAADLENAGSAGLDRSGRGGILRQRRLVVGAFDGDAVFVELGLSGLLGLGLCCLRGGFLGLAIGQFLGIGAAAQYIATQRRLVGSCEVGGTALGRRSLVGQCGFGLARLLDFIVPGQLNALTGGSSGLSTSASR